METQPVPLNFNTDFDPETGRPVSVGPGLVRVTAPNRGPYTFTGTNSFLVGDGPIGVIDPGPDDPQHLDALTAAIGGRRVDAILLTHTHRDHAGLARRLAAVTGAPLWFAGPHRLSRPLRANETDPTVEASDRTLTPDRTLADGENITLGGVQLQTVATPGHCANHIGFGVHGTETMLTGDHVMGWNSTLVAPPEGSMADYLASLEKLIGMRYERYLPAHGGPIADGVAHTRALLAHRLRRNEQILAALSEGAATLPELVGRIYPELAPALRAAARLTLTAHIEYLEERGLIRVAWAASGPRLAQV